MVTKVARPKIIAGLSNGVGWLRERAWDSCPCSCWLALRFEWEWKQAAGSSLGDKNGHNIESAREPAISSFPGKGRSLEEGSRRVLRVPVQIWGMSASGDVFIQQVHTVEVGPVGACIEGLMHELVFGEVIGLEYGNHRARFKVIQVGQKYTPEAGKAELRPLDRVQDFWGLRSGVAAQQSTSGERRSTARYSCKGSSSIRQSVTRFPLGAAVTDISLSGCYVESMSTLPVAQRSRW